MNTLTIEEVRELTKAWSVDEGAIHHVIAAFRLLFSSTFCELCHSPIGVTMEVLRRRNSSKPDDSVQYHAICMECFRLFETTLQPDERHFGGRFDDEEGAKAALISIVEVVPGDYVVSTDGVRHEIASIWGVDGEGRLAKPSEGGFGCVTTKGEKIDMWHAKRYLKRCL
jgi:hypothetical protein